MSGDILFLAHRIPYPPNKGDKIRAYHLLKALSSHYRVHVGAFIDDPEDWQHAEALQQMVDGQVKLMPIRPTLAKLASLRGLLTGEALSLPFYRNRMMQRWVDRLLKAGQVSAVVGFSSPVAQYVMGKEIPLVMDLVDVDSDKWLQYAQQRTGLMRRLYQREGHRLATFEAAVVERSRASYLVSDAEAAHLQELFPALAQHIHSFSNGVDFAFYTDDGDLPNPFESTGHQQLVFTGMMDYWPNIQAVVWFAQEILPRVQKRHPQVHFTIVGGRPPPQVQQLAENPGVTVTGRVADVRPYLAHAALAVAPMRTARGIQNKVLEAMAMAKAVVATPLAMEGIHPCQGLAQWVAEDADGLAAHMITLLDAPQRATEAGQLGRACVEQHYDWSGNLQPILDELAEVVG
uniref:Putative GT4: distantly related to phosphatidylinositol a-mannosyltransferase n=1 Tax=Magnetococcus massalia (strain MO-1) TaxID=451514 RepID=A0A1S7LME6_MAGMO|nr:Putative GT4 : distantly related to phosphatidylinositol a-mannosyltransferase [Candidatus Magnetococcus massalia]